MNFPSRMVDFTIHTNTQRATKCVFSKRVIAVWYYNQFAYSVLLGFLRSTISSTSQVHDLY